MQQLSVMSNHCCPVDIGTKFKKRLQSMLDKAVFRCVYGIYLSCYGNPFRKRLNAILVQESEDGLNLQIKQGKFIALSGIYDKGPRKLNIRFSYNRSFSGKQEYPHAGSWTVTLRPDYTLS